MVAKKGGLMELRGKGKKSGERRVRSKNESERVVRVRESVCAMGNGRKRGRKKNGPGTRPKGRPLGHTD